MRVVIAILLLLLIFFQYRLWVGEGSLAEVNNLQKEISKVKQENIKLQERNRSLQAEVDDLRSGQAAVEERARSELGMIKDGEIFYQVIDSQQDSSSE